MNLRAQLSRLIGHWTGTYRLWVSPHEPARQSQTTASIALAAHDAFATIRYEWADAGRPQDGLLIVRNSPAASPEDMVWIDSWHTERKFMLFGREADREGGISALGRYAVPSGPDWGWRIVLLADTPEELCMLMYNISPQGDAALAVQARYSRAAGS